MDKLINFKIGRITYRRKVAGITEFLTYVAKPNLHVFGIYHQNKTTFSEYFCEHNERPNKSNPEKFCEVLNNFCLSVNHNSENCGLEHKEALEFCTSRGQQQLCEDRKNHCPQYGDRCNNYFKTKE
eukprot:Pgem_evm1s4697